MDNITYDQMYQRFLSGAITESAWREYCSTIFNQILDDNRDVFIRLKHR